MPGRSGRGEVGEVKGGSRVTFKGEVKEVSEVRENYFKKIEVREETRGPGGGIYSIYSQLLNYQVI